MKTLRFWQEVINEPIKVHPVTDKTIELVKNNPTLFRGNVRLMTCRIWTTKDFDKYREKVLSTPLP